MRSDCRTQDLRRSVNNNDNSDNQVYLTILANAGPMKLLYTPLVLTSADYARQNQLRRVCGIKCIGQTLDGTNNKGCAIVILTRELIILSVRIGRCFRGVAPNKLTREVPIKVQ
jgi:hypothetical protein